MAAFPAPLSDDTIFFGPVSPAQVPSAAAAGFGVNGALPFLTAGEIGNSRLPSVEDPNSIRHRPTGNRTSLDVPVASIPALGLYSADVGGILPPFAFNFELRPGIYYDTGFDGDFAVFNPSIIALDNTPDAHFRGQTTWYNFGANGQNAFTNLQLPWKVEFDSQLLNVADVGRAQAYFDFYAPTASSIKLRNGYARFAAETQTNFLIGKGPTLFGDMGIGTVNLNSGALPVGFVGPYNGSANSFAYIGLSQIRLVQDLGENLQAAFSVEDQRDLNDLSSVDGVATFLNRFPTVIGRMRIGSREDFASASIAGLYRRFTIDDSNTFGDHFGNGYGFSALGRVGMASLPDGGYRDFLFASVAAGQGLGHYLYGGDNAAVIVGPDHVRAIGSLGIYAGLEHVWFRTQGGGSLFSSMGYSYLGSQMGKLEANKDVHGGWINLLYEAGKGYSIGLQYNYGFRRIAAGTTGDDHRIGLVLQMNFGSNQSASNQQLEVRGIAPAAPGAESTSTVGRALKPNYKERL